MPMSTMKFAEPFYVLVGGGLIPYLNDDFFLTRRFNQADGLLYANVGRNGRAGLEWIIDHDGRFIEFTSLGLVPKTLFQRIGLTRQKERFQIEAPRPITVGEFRSRIAKLKDRFQEAPVAAYARKRVKEFPDDRLMDHEIMTFLLGE